ncbi:aspartate/tyrosine/aromatic aminotransferase [Rhodoblastus acidophilus]|uniref:Aminotransferase n=1 Tax=Candidatus Rhodoblastus alkanivorans TaxID=2954117 RepID=A0ABS9ZAA9_9HYPH|nr:amino acid aminotransferase [Candidatus Rhodoblastus alkanivorans]MCI4677190.1 aspartate/tyrosine/aromatic aminotransferase [Candidatus Rhodoblastus alkanivorans]MCI4684543.1 aspartate/tyrosine/aromatic aminotransferase [Candidatus Rhodoblastus alkanivorans]MDI4641864.1 aspartate/tyrosine/aromatic aminotransferase [Rhodoblastus acidophilus]
MQSSLFAGVDELPRDPILGLTEAFLADASPDRVNLGVGVYQDETGKTPLLACVKKAEEALLAKGAPHSYVPIDGLAAYDSAVARMVFADTADLAKVAAVQALGGTGALKLGAELIRVISPQAKVWISDPSWENHRALFSAAGFTVETYPYYGADGELDYAGLIETLSSIPAGDVVLLHACCHNPTGLDLTHDQWREIAKIVRARGLVPFLDTAYMGFAEGLEADAFSVRLFAADGGPLFVSFSFSKSLSLYGERVGALCVLTASAEERARVLSQIKRIARVTYSSPPGHGGAAAAMVLTDPALRQQWDDELGAMRERIKKMRKLLADKLSQRLQDRDFSYIVRQNGMFSYSRLTKPQAIALREKYAVYALDSGRICVAALNENNIDYVSECIAKVMTEV